MRLGLHVSANYKEIVQKRNKTERDIVSFVSGNVYRLWPALSQFKSIIIPHLFLTDLTIPFQLSQTFRFDGLCDGFGGPCLCLWHDGERVEDARRDAIWDGDRRRVIDRV